MTTESNDVFCLASKDFPQIISNSLMEMYEKKTFSDVTLVTEDQAVFKSHKFILKTHSDVFKDIFQNENIDSKTVFLRGVKKTVLDKILKFCYLGSVEIEQENIMNFFDVATDLKINEFMKAQLSENDVAQNKNGQNVVTVANGKREETTFVDMGVVKNNNQQSEKKRGRPRTNEVKKVPSTDLALPTDTTVEKLDTETPENKAIIEQFLKHDAPAGGNNEVVSTSELSQETSVMTPQQRYPCLKCGMDFKTPQNLKRHVESIHEGIRYNCDQCDYQATQSTDIKRHKEYKHEGIKYNCEECDYKATTTGSLKLHVDSRHRGVRYPCNFCEHKSTTMASLGLHITSHHTATDKSFNCEFCDVVCRSKHLLKKHKQQMHTYTSQITFE